MRFFPTNDTVYEAWGLFALFVGGGIYISSLTQGSEGRAHVPALRVQLDLGKAAAIIRRVWVKKRPGRTFLLPEQMLCYTTLIYLRPLRSECSSDSTMAPLSPASFEQEARFL